MVKVFPTETLESLKLEIGGRRNCLLGDFVFVGSRLDGETLFQNLEQGRPHFPQQFE